MTCRDIEKTKVLKYKCCELCHHEDEEGMKVMRYMEGPGGISVKVCCKFPIYVSEKNWEEILKRLGEI